MHTRAPREVQEREDALWDEIAWDPTRSTKDNVLVLLSKLRRQMRDEFAKNNFSC